MNNRHGGGREKCTKQARHTFSIALLVGTPFDPLFALLPLGVNTLFGNTIFDTAETRTSVVTFLAGLLTMGASILDLSPL
jgi:hypothetical protein